RELYQIQNQVIRTLPRPPRSQYVGLSPDARDWYIGNFETQLQPDHPNTQVWMRYHNLEDVEKWARFLKPELPGVLDRHFRARRNWLLWRACPNCGSLGQTAPEGVPSVGASRQLRCPECSLTLNPRRELTALEMVWFV